MNLKCTYPDTHDVPVYCLENEYLKVSISSYGAMLKSLVYKPLNRETVLGLATFADDQRQSFYLGACVGRCGNRIAFGKFSLNDQVYELPLNGRHHLHGGIKGFDKAIFEGQLMDDRLILRHTSPDGDQGYPGTVEMEVSFRLEEASLIIDIKGQSDQDTLFDPTMHTYFNLNVDKAAITNHKVRLNSKTMYRVAENGVTDGTTLDVTNTVFDFRDGKKIGDCLNNDHEQLVRGRGLDNFFLKEHDLSFMAECRVDDLTLVINTDQMGAHVYTGNYLEKLDEKDEYNFLSPQGGICFETQHVPNSINFDLTKAPILRAGHTVTSQTIYTFEGVNYGN